MRSLRQPMRRVLDEKKMQVAAEPDGLLSKTDPDARSMAMSEFGPGPKDAECQHRNEPVSACIQF